MSTMVDKSPTDDPAFSLLKGKRSHRADRTESRSRRLSSAYHGRQRPPRRRNAACVIPIPGHTRATGMLGAVSVGMCGCDGAMWRGFVGACRR